MAARNRTNPCPAQSRAALPRPSIALLFACIAASALTSGAVAEPTSITLPGEATYPESITSTADGTLYVSSFASGGVVRVKPGAREGENWIAPGAFETRSTFGVLADEARGIFWVCSNDLSALGIKGPSEVKGAFLKGFDLKTGEGRISAPFPVSPAICNDIALGPDGSAYVTNTLGPHILWLKPGSQSLKVWKTDPLFTPEGKEAGLDGIAFGKDGHLYVNTFTKAKLFRVTVKDGAAGAVTPLTPLTPSRELVLADGLRSMADGSFLMAEGGGRLDRVTVEAAKATIETLKDGISGGVTAVTQVGATAWITVGQLAVLTDSSKKGSKPELPFRIQAVPLKTP